MKQMSEGTDKQNTQATKQTNERTNNQTNQSINQSTNQSTNQRTRQASKETNKPNEQTKTQTTKSPNAQNKTKHIAPSITSRNCDRNQDDFKQMRMCRATRRSGQQKRNGVNDKNAMTNSKQALKSKTRRCYQHPNMNRTTTDQSTD